MRTAVLFTLPHPQLFEKPVCRNWIWVLWEGTVFFLKWDVFSLEQTTMGCSCSTLPKIQLENK